MNKLSIHLSILNIQLFVSSSQPSRQESKGVGRERKREKDWGERERDAFNKDTLSFCSFLGIFWRPQILPYWRSCNEKLVDAHEVTSNHDVMAGSERNMLIMFY